MPTEIFPSRLDSLEKISEFVAKAARTAGLGEAAVYAVQLAVDEAATNIIEHAYGRDREGDIHCDCEPFENGLKVILTDYGKPFNPEAIPDPETNVPLEDLKPRGLGLFLMRKMMDEIHFDFTEDRGNILTMIKHKSN
jgi:serine/threonine-protein kinase RsbW